MKIITISLDKSILKNESSFLQRLKFFEKELDKNFVLLPLNKKFKKKLSEKTFILSSGGGNKVLQFFNLYKQVKKILKNKEVDLISVQDTYFLALLGFWLSKRFKKGLEIQVHGFEKFFGIRKKIAKFVLRRADSIRVVSQRLEKQMVEDLEVEKEKITVIPIYTDIEKLLKNKDKKAKGTENFVFLSISRLVEVKNIEMQIKQIKEVNKEREDVELWIAGDGEKRKKLEDLARDLKLLDKSVFFLGWHSEVEKLYPQADCFLLTSNAEGWGLTVIEAASFSMPIIMTDVGCADEVIKNKESGLVVPPKDEKALFEAMMKIINSKDLRQKLGKNAFEAINNLPDKKETLKLYSQSWQRAKEAKNKK